MSSSAATAERLRTALDLFRIGVDMMRKSLTRKHPDASAEEIEILVEQWLRQRPGAEHGDAVGRVVSRPGLSR